ncbi:hypothetical protein [Chamaesiphon polymorphus]|uniref:Uncharacterized protein n=1 Tax=Chamaesiphon polymorphus CCALA 037 TaxID=2107692 RepID=A0A2T1GBX5_9CYAN|nr:hypothetical protein [Chamaesiphon polymorphus]PSB54829.1 hypothetical protein C7B77_16925 [Chamaesiphon polymorphus CCALA 037]
MGTRYSNITLQGVSQSELVAYLSDTGLDAYVSPTIDRYTVLYDVASTGYPEAIPLSIQREENLQDLLCQYKDGQKAVAICLSSHLSKKFSCSVLAVCATSSLTLWYHLSQNGLMLDEYLTEADRHWKPGRMLNETGNGTIKGGDAKKICNAFSKEDAISQVEIILTQPIESFDSMTRHTALAKALSIHPSWVVGMNFLCCTGEDDFEAHYEANCDESDPTSDEALTLVKGTLPKVGSRLI